MMKLHDMKTYPMIGLIFLFSCQSISDSGKSTFDLESQISILSNDDAFITAGELNDLISSEDPSFTIIDLRSGVEYNADHIDGAKNIATQNLLDEEHSLEMEGHGKVNILYGNNSSEAYAAWQLVSIGSKANVKALAGGISHFRNQEMGMVTPGSAEFDYRQMYDSIKAVGAKDFIAASPPKLPIKRVVKKKKKEEEEEDGC